MTTAEATPTPLPTDAQAVLDFWFGAPGDPQHGQFRDLWFVKSAETDRAIADRFGDLVELALREQLNDWDATPRGTLALIVLLDQFTRNSFRDTPRAFAGDPLALALAQGLVAAGHDTQLSPFERAFAYLPFEHAEDAALQDESVRLFDVLTAEAPMLAGMLDYAQRHRDVVRRFGRFPHRNEVLGRASTAEELAFLREPGSRF